MGSKKEDTIICRCEEVFESDVLKAIRLGARDVDTVKRMTRAGMGLCQGRTCTELIINILSRELGIEKKNLKPMTVRPPLRLVPSKAFLIDE